MENLKHGWRNGWLSVSTRPEWLVKGERCSSIHRWVRKWPLASVLVLLGLGAVGIAARHSLFNRYHNQSAGVERAARLDASLQRVKASGTVGRPASLAPSKLRQAYAQLPMGFEANQGQAAPDVRFISRGSGYVLFLTTDGATLGLHRPLRHSAQDQSGLQSAPLERSNLGSLGNAGPGGYGDSLKTKEQDLSLVRLKLVGFNAKTHPTGLNLLPGKSNYFVGHDPAKWHAGVNNYAVVSYGDVYPGVELVFYGHQRRLEYDFKVAPGADLTQIAWELQGASHSTPATSIDSHGNLLVHLGDGVLSIDKPVAYEFSANQAGPTDGKRRFLDARYTPKANGRFGFTVADHDPNKMLVIDPVLQYSTYLGGSLNDEGSSIAVDSSGNAYVTGQTLSTNFPLLNAEQPLCPSCTATTPAPSVFVTEIDPTGSALVYSTYLGGSATNQGNGIAVDSAGDAYVTGATNSIDFPTTPGAFQTTCTSCSLAQPLTDAFVAKLSPTGSLVYSTYLGGSKNNAGNAIAVDSGGNAYVTGTTSSSDFVTQNPLPAPNNVLQGTTNAFVTKFDPNGALLSSTYLGGSNQDTGYGIAVDSSGIYVAGQTSSNNFPTLTPFQGTYDGNGDGFVSKLTPDASGLIYSTYLGGTATDGVAAIAIDSSGHAFVTGGTSSTNFPISPGAFQAAYGGGTSDAFVAELNAAGTHLLYSTYLGGSGQDSSTGIAVDTSGNANVVGQTASGNFPTSNPFQAAYAGNSDAFVTRFVPSGCAPTFSTYLGGHSTDIGTGIAVDSSGNAYITGYTDSNDFPVQSAFQGVTGGDNDAFLARLNTFTAPAVCLNTNSVNFTGQAVTTTSAEQTITLTNGGNSSLSITSITASGDFAQTNTCGNSLAMGANCPVQVTFAPTASGLRSGAITITDSAGNSPQSIALTGTGTDFGLSVTPPTATVTAGQPASFTLTLTPINGFDSAVTLTCSGAPSNSTCTPSSSSVTLNGSSASTVTVNVTTVARAGLIRFRVPEIPRWGRGVGGGVLLLLGLAILVVLARAPQSLKGCKAMNGIRLAVLATMLGGAVLWPGCGFTANNPTGTPAGNYPLQIAVADGTLQHSIAVTLTVN
ncbi:MAG TPA: SBBP repeat-containing protein [Terriglobia bacterium]|nr:SBBP repeat-containing protein [Terriglobia bacterium]